MGRFAKQNMLRMCFVFLFCEIGKCSSIKHVIWSLVLGVEGCLEIREPFLRKNFSPKTKSHSLFTSATLSEPTTKPFRTQLPVWRRQKAWLVSLWRGGWCVGQEMIKTSQKGGSWENRGILEKSRLVKYCEILSLEMWIWFDIFFP